MLPERNAAPDTTSNWTGSPEEALATSGTGWPARAAVAGWKLIAWWRLPTATRATELLTSPDALETTTS